MTKHTYVNPQYPESKLTAQLIGLAYEMANRLGYGYHEKYFQRAYAQLLTSHDIPFIQERKVVINFEGKGIGRYFIDFVIAGKVVVELKIANAIYSQHMKQVLAYLKATGLSIGLLVVIAKQGVKIKRIINTPHLVQPTTPSV